MLSAASSVRRHLLPLAALLVCAAPAFSQNFQFQRFGLYNGPEGVAVGDFNGDGRLDYAVADINGNSVDIVLNHGNATFHDNTADIMAATGSGPFKIVVGDFNRDGKLDIATANTPENGGPGSVSILYGNGDGTFRAPLNIALPGVPNSIAITDSNGDGLPDLAVACDNTNDIRIVRNTGGGFTLDSRRIQIAGQSLYGVSSADFNLDNRQDLAVIAGPGWATGMPGSAYVLYNTGSGYTPSKIASLGAPMSTRAVNVNNDRYPDLVVTDNSGSSPAFHVFTNRQGSGFSQQTVPLTGEYTLSGEVTMADMNGDGIPDLVATAFGNFEQGYSDCVFVLPGRVGGGFGAPECVDQEPGQYPYHLAVGDFNGDRRYDIVAAVNKLQVVDVLINGSTAAGCAAPAGSGMNRCSATSGSAAAMPVRASVTMGNPVDHVEVWIDGAKKDQVYGNAVDKSYALSAGTHRIGVVAVDQAGAVVKYPYYVTAH